MYDYREAVKDAVIEYLNENIKVNPLLANDTKISVKEYVNVYYNEILEDMELSDGVTGKGSGSFTFDRRTAKEYVLDNLDIVAEMYENGYISNSHVVNMILYGQWETMDVIIRCYLLPQIFGDIVVKM